MPSLSELRAKEADLRRLLAQAKALSKPGGSHADRERARDRARKREALHASKALLIPACKDPLRREQLEADAVEWLRFYLPDIFPDPFCDHHLEMIDAIERATVFAQDQAIAAPRGEGKSTICEGLTVRNILRGRVPFVASRAVPVDYCQHDACGAVAHRRQLPSRG